MPAKSSTPLKMVTMRWPVALLKKIKADAKKRGIPYAHRIWQIVYEEYEGK